MFYFVPPRTNSSARATALITLRGEWLFVMPLAVFLGLHLVLRLLLSVDLHQDDADIVLFNQALAFGYSEQAPLYSWLYWLWSQIAGVTHLSLALFRTLLMAGTATMLYLAAGKMFHDQRLARWATFSLFLVPQLVWHTLHHLTHSLLLSFCCALTFYALVRVVQLGRGRDYLLFGVSAGCGLLAKYNYPFYLAALLSAGLTLPAVRRKLLTWPTGAALLLGGLMFLPHGLWILQHRDFLTQAYANKLVGRDLPWVFGFVPKGVLELLVNFCIFTATGAGMMALFFGRDLWQHTPSATLIDVWQKWLFRYFVLLAGLLLVYLFVVGADRFHERWLEPFFLVLPLLLFCRLCGESLPAWRWRRYGGFLLALACVSVVIPCWQFGEHPLQPHSTQATFDEFADRLTKELPPECIIITHDSGIGGNVLFRLPQRWCVSINHVGFSPPAAARQTKYLLMWDLRGDVAGLPEPLLQHAQRLSERILVPRGKTCYVNIATPTSDHDALTVGYLLVTSPP